MAKARMTDPQTSHEAAGSVKNISLTQVAILGLLKRPMADQELVQLYSSKARLKQAPMASESGIRSRRAELVALGLVGVAGFGRTASNRKTTLWVAK